MSVESLQGEPGKLRFDNTELTYPWEFHFPKGKQWQRIGIGQAAAPEAQFVRMDARVLPIKVLEGLTDVLAVRRSRIWIFYKIFLR